jgi:hypothetical protein
MPAQAQGPTKVFKTKRIVEKAKDLGAEGVEGTWGPECALWK